VVLRRDSDREFRTDKMGCLLDRVLRSRDIASGPGLWPRNGIGMGISCGGTRNGLGQVCDIIGVGSRTLTVAGDALGFDVSSVLS